VLTPPPAEAAQLGTLSCRKALSDRFGRLARLVDHVDAASVRSRTGSAEKHEQRRRDVNDARLGLGRRIAAVVINIIALIVLLVVVGLLFHKTHTGHQSASVKLTGVSALIWFVLVLAYLIVPKVRTGQTIGRRLVGGRPSR
jgi:hypothetical protein